MQRDIVKDQLARAVIERAEMAGIKCQPNLADLLDQAFDNSVETPILEGALIRVEESILNAAPPQSGPTPSGEGE